MSRLYYKLRHALSRVMNAVLNPAGKKRQYVERMLRDIEGRLAPGEIAVMTGSGYGDMLYNMAFIDKFIIGHRPPPSMC